MVRLSEAERVREVLRAMGLDVQVLDPGPQLLCRAAGHPEVPDRLRRLGVRAEAVPALGPEHWCVEVGERPANDRLVQAVWALLAAF